MINTSIANMSQDKTTNPQTLATINKQSPIKSDILFKNSNIVLIQHHGEYYRLRRTRQDKLILTK